MTSSSNGCCGVIQTPFRHQPAIRVLLLSDDEYNSSTMSQARIDPPQGSCVRDVLFHLANTVKDREKLLCRHGLLYDVIISMGSIMTLDRELFSIYELFQSQMISTDRLKESIRNSLRSHVCLPEQSQLLSRGAHYFTTFGILRKLVHIGTSSEFLRMVHQILRTYDHISVTTLLDPILTTDMVHRMDEEGRILLVRIDTMENYMKEDFAFPYGQWVRFGFCDGGLLTKMYSIERNLVNYTTMGYTSLCIDLETSSLQANCHTM